MSDGNSSDEASEPEATSPVEEAESEDPFADLDALEEAGPASDDPFTEMETDTAESDADVFEILEGDADGALAQLEGDAPAPIETVPEIDDAGEGVVVPKRTYCEQCEYLSEPPEVSCSNEGTTIHELTDLEHFRVSNCPVVEDRRSVQERLE